MIRIAYLIEMITMSDHRIRDAIPITVSSDSVPAACAACLNA
jgi:hypothetical protein